jgi:hypothetical protein
MGISADDRSLLLALARESVWNYINRLPLPQPQPQGILREHRGCFVTLKNNGELRGCIGTFQPQGPLATMIPQMAVSAARDPRFVTNPITPTELPALNVEVSVLTPLEQTEHPEQLQIGRHGIYIVCQGRSGCFLPEVATEYNMQVEEFLDTCCQHKAGLPAGAWKRPDCEVYLFESEKFSEKD